MANTLSLNENLKLINDVYESLNRDYKDLFDPSDYEKYEQIYKQDSIELNGVIVLHPSDGCKIDLKLWSKKAEIGIMYILISMFETHVFRTPSKKHDTYRRLDSDFALGFFNPYINTLQQRIPAFENEKNKFLVYQKFWPKKKFVWEKFLEACSSISAMENKIIKNKL